MATPLFAQEVSLTAEEQAWLDAHPEVSIAYPGGYPPYSFQDQQGRFKGISVDYVNEIARRTGLKLKVYPDGNWENLYSAALQREVDAVGGIIRRPERDEWFAFTKPYLSTAQHIITRKDQSGIRHRNDIAGKTIALVKGYATTRSLLEEFPTVKPYYVDNVMAAFEAVSLGHADACLGVMGATQHFVAEKGIQNLRFAVMFSDEITDWRISVRKDWPVLQAIFDKALASISDDERHKIFLRWTTLEVAQVEAVKSVKGTLKLTEREQAWIAENHPIRVSFWKHPPLFYLKDGKVVGIAVDLLNRISADTGLSFHYENRLDRFADVLKGLKDHNGPDVVGALMPTAEREKGILFTRSYFNSPRFIFTRDDAPFIPSIEHLNGKTVAVVEDYVIHHTLVEKYPDIDLLIFHDNEEALRAVSMGKAFAFIGDLVSTPAMINEFGLKNIKAACPSRLPDHPLAIGIRNDWPELLNIIDKALYAMPAYEKTAIINKWDSVQFDYGISLHDVKKWLLIIGSIVALILFLIIFWNRSLARKVKERTSTLAESDDRLRLATAAARVAIWDFDPRSNAVFLSPEWKQQLGYEDDEIESRNEEWESRLHPDDREEAFNMLEDYLAGRIPEYKREFRLRHKDGSYRWILTRGEKKLDDVGNPVRILGCHVDITERKQAQAFLEESESRFRATFEQAAVGISHVSPEGHFLRINQKFCDIVGYPREEMIAKTFQEITHPEDLESDLKQVKQLLSGEINTYSMDKRYMRKDGSFVWINLTVSLVRNEAGEPLWFVSAIKDITDRKEALEALKESEEKFRELIEQSPTTFELYDKEGVLLQVNGAFERLWNLSRNDVVGKFNVLTSKQVKEKGLLPYFQKAFAGETVTPPDIEFDASLEEVDHREKSRKRWVSSLLYAVRDIQGQVTHVVMMHEDISKQRFAEQQMVELRNELLHSTRAGTMVELTAALAHELNHPLGSILNNANAAKRFLEKKEPDLDEIREIIADIISEDRRASDVIQKLRALMKKEDIKFTSISISAIVEEVIKFTHSDFVIKGISLSTELAGGPLVIFGDRTQLQQVLLNLILNAGDAVKEAPVKKICISTSVDDAGHVLICVKDSGPGIEESEKDSLFKPFYSTKKQGMGMGLSVCQTIIKAHRGDIRAENNPDGGASFFVRLPVIATKSA